MFPCFAGGLLELMVAAGKRLMSDRNRYSAIVNDSHDDLSIFFFGGNFGWVRSTHQFQITSYHDAR